MPTAGQATAPSPRPEIRSGLLRAVPWTPLAGLVPGALTLYLAFESGGFFPGATAVATLVLALLLLARVLLADDPFAGVSVPLAVAGGGMMLFAAWTLASAEWSDSSARALLEFDRVLLYLLALVWFGSFARSSRFVRWVLWGLALAMTAICAAGFITRTLPDVWSAPAEVERERLAYPIGYWNALGLTASFALVFCLHLTSSAREPRAARILAAAACPLLGATLVFTYSRGPIAIACLGLLAYLVLGRPRLLVTGLLASAPATAAAVLVAYNADHLAEFVKGEGLRLSEEAAAQGHDVALAVALCAAGAAAIRALGVLALDGALERFRLGREVKRRLALAAGMLALAGLVAAGIVATRGDWLETQSDRLFSDPVTQTGDYRDRLFNPGINRLDRWEVALDSFEDEPLAGNGAGTYRLLWERNRPTDSDTNDAHSLYLEVMGELGLVGIVLLALVLLTILGGLAIRSRGRGRALYAVVLAAALMWVAHAALDWDWEIPAITLWLFAAGGAALAAPAGPQPSRRLGLPIRLGIAAGILVLAIVPARIAISQARIADALDANDAGDCLAAVDAAEDAISVLGSRPEPYEIQAYCQSRTRTADGGVSAMEEAVERDPRNWELRYGLALVRAAAGLDPRRQARAARRLNPRENLASDAVRSFRGDNPARWRRAVASLERSPEQQSGPAGQP
jgi:O-Antigen ligase